jgi:hypothetical protein
MSVPEPFKLTVRGFSSRRVGYVLAFLSFTFVPIHSYVSCEVSVLTFGLGLILFLAVLLLSLCVPRGEPNRFRPLAFAFFALVAHVFSTH